MRIFANPDIHRLFRRLAGIELAFLLLAQLAVRLTCGQFSPLLALVCLAAGGALLAVSYGYFCRQDALLEQAVA